jgi:hypothetical protein
MHLEQENLIATTTVNEEEVFEIRKRFSSLLNYIDYFLSDRYDDYQLSIDQLKAKNEHFWTEEAKRSLEIHIVNKLEPIYKLKSSSSITTTILHKQQSNVKTLLFNNDDEDQTLKYFIRSDQTNNQHELVKGLLKYFTVDSFRIKSAVGCLMNDDELNREYSRDLLNYSLLVYSNLATAGTASNYLIRNEMILNEIEHEFQIKIRNRSLENNKNNSRLTVSIQTLITTPIKKAEKSSKQQSSYGNCSNSNMSRLLDYRNVSRNQLNVDHDDEHESSSTITVDFSKINFESLLNKTTEDKQFYLIDQSNNEEFVEAENDKKKNLTASTIQSNEFNVKVGRFGELWVWEILKKKHENDIYVELEWMNEMDESGLPYDFILTNKRIQRIKYIEVKSSVRKNKNVFPISLNELMFMKTNEENFEIYRLSNVSEEHPDQITLKILTNLANKLNEHQYSLFMAI